MSPRPTTTLILPPEPLVDASDAIRIDPLEPSFELPESNVSAPTAPLESAELVSSVNEPLELKSPNPVPRDTEPPLTCKLVPALIATRPPGPAAPSPALILILPAVPCVAKPVCNTADPLAPLLLLPVFRVIDPEMPLTCEFDVRIVKDPLE